MRAVSHTPSSNANAAAKGHEECEVSPMNNTAAHTLDQARKELGYAESPPGSNIHKFAAEAGHVNRQAWCASFVSAILIRCGVIAKGAKVLSPSSRTMYAEAKRHGWTVPFELLVPGDVIHTWRGISIGKWLGHVGFVEQVLRDGNGKVTGLITIEGNTNRAGSATGGEVLRKTRTRAFWRLGGWHPPYASAPAPVPKVLWLMPDGRIVEPVGTGTPTPVRWLPTLNSVQAKLSAGWVQINAPKGVTVRIVS
jgi:hypothetical protein